MRELSLFTGAGGGLLGSMLLGWRTVAAVEYEPYCQRVLCARGGYMANAGCSGDELDGGPGETPGSTGAAEREASQRQRSGDATGHGGSFPVYGDIRDFDARPFRGKVDIVTGGFPCQPFSQAGKRLGADDPRNMWPHTVRVLRESGAPLGFFENVPGLLSSGYFGTVLGDLAESGFDAEWCVLGADDVGAPHRRKRLWILAYRHGYDAGVRRGAVGGEAGAAGRHTQVDLPAGRGEVPGGAEDVDDAKDADRRGASGQEYAGGWPAQAGGSDSSPWSFDPADLGDPAAAGLEEWLRDPDQSRDARTPRAVCEDGAGRDDWLAEPYVGRVAHGVAKRVDRLRALGNGQVPQCMALAFTYLAARAGLMMVLA